MNKNILLEKSLNLLEWPALLAHLGARAHSNSGKQLCLNLRPEVSEERVETLQSETAEMIRLLREQRVPPAPCFADSGKEIAATRKNILLEPQALLDISSTIKLSESYRRFFSPSHDRCHPELTALSLGLSGASEIVDEIEKAIDEQGRVKESASIALSKLYSDQRGVRDVVKKKLEHYLTQERYAPAIRDKYLTVREERYVIPVKSEMQNRIDGIIHDSSQSGMTIFIEPEKLIPLNNRLRLISLEIERETHRILTSLSELVSAKASELINNIRILSYFDLVQAKGELALAMDATRPTINKTGKLNIREGRHPLLSLQAEKTVPNTISLGGEVQVLVISGPNTGGKTVMLKTAGLLSLMQGAGLHIPAGEGSELPLFTEIYADIGDEQDISNNLSTFAGHLKNVASIMEHLSHSSLVLLDEFMASTDPTEGSALAESILDKFARKKAITIVSTHFSELKYAAAEKNYFLNGCMEIDPVTLLPTYKLIQGVPGRSHALDIAKRLGMDPGVILSAEKITGSDERSREKLSELLDTARLELKREKEQVLSIKRETELLREESRKVRDELLMEKGRFKREKAVLLKREIERAKTEISEALSGLEKEKREQSVQKASKSLQCIEKSADIGPDLSGCAPLSTFSQGEYIFIPALNISGTLLTLSSRKNLVKVSTGKAEITLNSKSSYGRLAKRPASKRSDFHKNSKNHRNKEENIFRECSLRGLTEEVAMDRLTKFLDLAIQQEIHSVRIIHGHGTGVIKKSVRQYLKTSPYASSFKPGLSNEGGDGVTIVKLRE